MPVSRTKRQLVIVVGAAVVLGAALWPAFGPWWAWLAAVNVVAFAVYVVDKYQATRGGWRIAEAALYVLALAGGTAGSILGQQACRHKTRKSTFRWVFWTIVVIQALGLTLWLANR